MQTEEQTGKLRTVCCVCSVWKVFQETSVTRTTLELNEFWVRRTIIFTFIRVFIGIGDSMAEIRELRIFEMGNETVMANILDRTSDESDFTAKVF